MRRSMWDFASRRKTEHVKPRPVRYDELDREILVRLLVNLSARVEQRAAEAAQSASLADRLQSRLDQEQQARQADQAAFESHMADLAREREALAAHAARAEIAATLASDLDAARANLERTQAAATSLDRRLNEVTTVYNQIRTQSQNREQALLDRIRDLERGRTQSENAASYATATLAAANRDHATELTRWQEREREIAMQVLSLNEEKAQLNRQLTELETAVHDRETAVNDLTRQMEEAGQSAQRRMAETENHAAAAQRTLDEQREAQARRTREAEKVLAALEEAQARLASERDLARAQLAAAETALADRDTRLTALQQREEGLADRAREADRIEDNLQQLRQELKSQGEAYAAQARDMDAMRHEFTSQAEALRAELSAARQAFDVTQARLADEQTRLLQAAQREQDLQAYVQRLTGELQEAHAQATQHKLQAGGENGRVLKLEEDLTREREGFHQVIARLSAESRHNSELAVQLQKMLEAEQAKSHTVQEPAAGHVAELQAETEAAQAKAAEALARLSGVQQQFTRLKAAYEEAQSSARQRQEELTTALADARRTLDSLKYQLSELLAERHQSGKLQESEALSIQKELTAARGTADQMTALAETLRAEKAEVTEIARTEIERLQGLLTESAAALKTLTGRHESLRLEQDALNRTHATLQAEHQTTVKALGAAREAADQSRALADTLRTEKTELTEIARTEIEHLQGLLTDSAAALKTLTERHEALRREQETLTRTHAARQAEHQTQMAALAAAREAADQSRALADTLRTEKTALEQNARAEAGRLQGLLTDSAAALKTITERHEALRREQDALTRTHAALRTEHQTMVKALAAAREAADQSRVQADTLRTEKTALEQNARAEAGRLQGLMTESAAALKTVTERHEALRREQDTLTRTHAALQAEHQTMIEEARGVVDALRHDLDDRTAALSRAQADLETARRAVEAERQQRLTENETARRETEAVRSELSQWRATVEALRHEKAEAAETAHRALLALQTQHDETRQTLEAERKLQQADVARRNQWEEELRQRVERFADENERHTARLEKRETELTAELAQANAATQDLSSRLETAANELSAARRQLDEARETQTRLKEETDRTQADAQARIQLLMQNGEEHERALKDARRRLEAAEEQQRALRQDAVQNEQNLLRQIERLKSDVRTAGGQLTEARRRVEMQEEQLRNLRQQRVSTARDVPRATLIEIPRGTATSGEPEPPAPEAAPEVVEPEIVSSPSMAKPATNTKADTTPRTVRPQRPRAGHSQQQTLSKLENQLQSELQTWDQLQKDKTGNGTLSKVKNWLGAKPRPTDEDKP